MTPSETFQLYLQAIAAGVVVISASTPALNGAYPCDIATRRMMDEQARHLKVKKHPRGVDVRGKPAPPKRTGVFRSGDLTKKVYDMDGVAHVFSGPQYAALNDALMAYEKALGAAWRATLSRGEWVAPSATIQI